MNGQHVASPPHERTELASDTVRASDPATAPNDLWRLACRGGRHVRIAVARHPNCPHRALVRLAGDADEQVRNQVAAHTTATLPVFNDVLSRAGPHSSAYWRIAQNPAATAEILVWLAATRGAALRGLLLGNPSTPPDAASGLLAGADVEERQCLARRGDLDGATIEALTGDCSVAVRCAVASNPHMAAATLERLAADRYRSVRTCVADNWDTPGHVLDVLAADEATSPYVAHNPRTPPATLTALAVTAHRTGTLSAVLRHPACPPEAVAGVVSSAALRARHRAALLANKHTPPDVWAPAPGDDRYEWARILATNTGCPPVLLAALAGGSDQCRGNVAANAACPAVVQQWLAADTNSRVRERLANNPASTEETLRFLAADESPSVRVRVAGAANAAPDTFHALATDVDPHVIDAVAANAATPPAVLGRLAESPSCRPRVAVAANPSTGPATLARLAGDVSAEVRRHATRNAAQRGMRNVLGALRCDANEMVRRELCRAEVGPLNSDEAT